MKPRPISDREFEQEVSKSDGLVIMDFCAPWSRPCRIVLPILEVLGERYNGQLKIVTLNVDKYPELTKELGIVRIPTILFFLGGKVVDKGEGISSVKYLEARIQRLLPMPECETDSETGHCGCGSA
ncbi:MAG: thiol reductase thioredoxin [Ignavibacteriae bacterium]|nr:thiol reductase thioredoxin [Ignavibacteriota bacterium]